MASSSPQLLVRGEESSILVCIENREIYSIDQTKPKRKIFVSAMTRPTMQRRLKWSVVTVTKDYLSEVFNSDTHNGALKHGQDTDEPQPAVAADCREAAGELATKWGDQARPWDLEEDDDLGGARLGCGIWRKMTTWEGPGEALGSGGRRRSGRDRARPWDLASWAVIWRKKMIWW